MSLLRLFGVACNSPEREKWTSFSFERNTYHSVRHLVLCKACHKEKNVVMIIWLKIFDAQQMLLVPYDFFSKNLNMHAKWDKWTCRSYFYVFSALDGSTKDLINCCLIGYGKIEWLSFVLSWGSSQIVWCWKVIHRFQFYLDGTQDYYGLLIISNNHFGKHLTYLYLINYLKLWW